MRSLLPSPKNGRNHTEILAFSSSHTPPKPLPTSTWCFLPKRLICSSISSTFSNDIDQLRPSRLLLWLAECCSLKWRWAWRWGRCGHLEVPRLFDEFLMVHAALWGSDVQVSGLKEFHRWLVKFSGFPVLHKAWSKLERILHLHLPPKRLPATYSHQALLLHLKTPPN